MVHKVIAERVDHAVYMRFVESSYVHARHNEDDTYTLMVESLDYPEVYAFGYKLKDSDDALGIKNAWIKPDGSIYYVFYWGHDPFACGIMGSTIRNLEKANWVHWSHGEIANESVVRRLTRAQKDALYYITSNDNWL